MKRLLQAMFRLGFAGLTLVAVSVQLWRHVGYQFNVVNFFSYFTNLSNIFIAVVFLIGAYFALKGKEPRWFVMVRGAATLAIVIVGVVFSLLLRTEDLGTLLPWVNDVLHYLMPVVGLIDWLLWPPKTSLKFRQTLPWLVYPLAYVTYSLIRGAATKWYAYPFLNPDKVHGYGGVALYCVGITLLFLGGAWLLIALGRWRRARMAA